MSQSKLEDLKVEVQTHPDHISIGKIIESVESMMGSLENVLDEVKNINNKVGTVQHMEAKLIKIKEN